MKKIFKRLFIIFIISVSCMALTGCKGIKIGNYTFYFGTYTGSGPDTEESETGLPSEEKLSGLILILGNHANSKEFDLVKDFDPNTGKYKELINNAIHTVNTNSGYQFEAEIYVIVNDGNPQKVDLPKDLLQVSTGSLDFEQADRADMTQNIASYLSDEKNRKMFIANDEHANLLSSLGIAANIIKNNPNTEYTVFVYDTGICTSGSLNMVDYERINFVEDEVENILNCIYDEEICNLNGAKVYIPYLLNVSDKQNNSYYEDGVQSYLWNVPGVTDKMVTLWTGVVEKCKGTIGIIASNKLDSAEDMDYTESGVLYPFVPTVTFYKNHPSEEINPNPIVADSSMLGFISGKAEFKKGKNGEDGKAAAKNAIAPFVETWKAYLSQDANNVLYVVGSIAKINKNVPVYKKAKLSSYRATAVKDLLEEEGIPAEQIIAIDAGETVLKGWRDADEFANGEFDTEIADKNRVVAIIPNCEASDPCVTMMNVLKECELIP